MPDLAPTGSETPTWAMTTPIDRRNLHHRVSVTSYRARFQLNARHQKRCLVSRLAIEGYGIPTSQPPAKSFRTKPTSVGPIFLIDFMKTIGDKQNANEDVDCGYIKVQQAHISAPLL
jgi:hypothetical protein